MTKAGFQGWVFYFLQTFLVTLTLDNKEFLTLPGHARTGVIEGNGDVCQIRTQTLNQC